MALPVLAKTWQFKPNNRILLSSETADHQRDVFEFKKAFTDSSGWVDKFGAAIAAIDVAGLWVVRGSSNGAGVFTACPVSPLSAPSVNADRWLTAANVNWRGGGSNFSWIVLRIPGLSSPTSFYEVLISCDQTNTGYFNATVSVYVSFSAGFTGGTATARPTATDEYYWRRGTDAVQTDTSGSSLNNGYWETQHNVGGFTRILNTALSTDGQCSRHWCYVRGSVISFWNFERPANVHASWANIPNICCGVNQVSAINTDFPAQGPIYLQLYDRFLHLTKVNSTVSAAVLTSESYQSTPIGRAITIPGDMDGAWPLTPIGIYANSTGIRARIGTLTDLYFGSTAPGDGDTYPLDATRQLIQLGDLIHPWPRGVLPQTI